MCYSSLNLNNKSNTKCSYRCTPRSQQTFGQIVLKGPANMVRISGSQSHIIRLTETQNQPTCIQWVLRKNYRHTKIDFLMFWWFVGDIMRSTAKPMMQTTNVICSKWSVYVSFDVLATLGRHIFHLSDNGIFAIDAFYAWCTAVGWIKVHFFIIPLTIARRYWVTSRLSFKHNYRPLCCSRLCVAQQHRIKVYSSVWMVILIPSCDYSLLSFIIRFSFLGLRLTQYQWNGITIKCENT